MQNYPTKSILRASSHVRSFAGWENYGDDDESNDDFLPNFQEEVKVEILEQRPSYCNSIDPYATGIEAICCIYVDSYVYTCIIYFAPIF